MVVLAQRVTWANFVYFLSMKWDLLAGLSGFLLACGFPPYNLAWISIPALALFLEALQKTTHPYRTALFFSCSFFGWGASWVFVSIQVFGQAPYWLATLLTAGFVLVWSLLQALIGPLLSPHQKNPRELLLGFPCLWILLEYARSWLFTGFPWLLLGTAQVSTSLGHFAPLGGVWLVSGLVALGGVLLFQRSRKSLLGLATLYALGATLGLHPWTQPQPKRAVPVALIQPAIAQDRKWMESTQLETLERLAGLSEQARTQAEWLIWPESAMTWPYPDARAWLESLQIPLLLTGIPKRTPTHHYTNALWLVGTSQFYEKQQLVPFGEYVPFEHWLRGLIRFFDLPMSDFEPGQTHLPFILPTTQGPISLGAAICYEMAYPNAVRLRARQAEALVTVSNDAWFGHSPAAAQHLQIAQMRAKETGRMVLRATNNGFTAIIQADGQVLTQLPQDKVAILYGSLTPVEGKTPWLRYGPWPLRLFIVLTLGGLYSRRYRQRRR